MLVNSSGILTPYSDIYKVDYVVSVVGEQVNEKGCWKFRWGAVQRSMRKGRAGLDKPDDCAEA